MDQKSSLVSVVVPIFNSGRFLQETIESVLAQSYTSWELLLVDDGSTDNSPEISQQYAKRFPGQIYYMEHIGHQNLGVCSSRNLGVRHAQGSYIAFLDADDVWLSHKLEHQVAIMEAYPEVGMVFSMSRYWSSWSQSLEKVNCDYIPDFKLPTDTIYQPRTLTTLSYPLGKAHAPCPSNILLRGSVVAAVGGFEESFQRSYQLYEDQAFLSKVYLTTAIYVSSTCCDFYRLHNSSCMATTINYLEIRLFFLTWLDSYLHSNGIEDRQIWQALWRAHWPYRYPHLHRLITLYSKTAQQAMNWIRSTVLQMFLFKW